MLFELSIGILLGVSSHSYIGHCLRLADLLTEVVAVLSDRNLIIGLSFWPFPLIRLIFFRMHSDQGVRS